MQIQKLNLAAALGEDKHGETYVISVEANSQEAAQLEKALAILKGGDMKRIEKMLDNY